MENNPKTWILVCSCVIVLCLPLFSHSSHLRLNSTEEGDCLTGLAWNRVLNRQMQTRDPNWVHWKNQYRKKYPNLEEELRGYSLWSQNYIEVFAHNERFFMGQEFYTKTLNRFSDDCPGVIRAKLTTEFPHLDNRKVSKVPIKQPKNGNLPDYRDWRESAPSLMKHPVRCQGKNPYGWMFAAMDAIQSNLYIQIGKRFTLSVQELLDCMEDFGFKLGSVVDAFLYIGQRGISFERNYPFSLVKGTCSERFHTVTLGLNTIHRLNPGDENHMKWMIATTGPVVAHIHVTDNLVLYSSGVFWDNTCLYSSPPNHAVLVMGYGTDPVGGDFWLIKNSWGPFWGENGYMRMSRNSLYNCAITSAALYPLITS